jgi:hypothetical protein
MMAVEWIVERVFRDFAAKPLMNMVGTRRLELLTSTVSNFQMVVSY